MQDIKSLREMMKSYTVADEDYITDQQLNKNQPPMVKYFENAKRIPLQKSFETIVKNRDIMSIFEHRRSRREYSQQPITMGELSFLLWATQGVKKVVDSNDVTLRNVPSAGARHPYETYIYANAVMGLEKGLYHYLPIEHELELLENLSSSTEYEDQMTEAFIGQSCLVTAPITFVWTVVPYRSEYRYASKAHRCALMDAGCIGENLYLACEAIHCGTCMIAAFDQALADGLLGLYTKPTDDYENEFVVFAAGVGKQRTE